MNIVHFICITVNSEIIAMFLSLRKMRQGYNRKSLNSHFSLK